MDDKTKNILNTMKAFSNVSQIPVTLLDENGEPAWACMPEKKFCSIFASCGDCRSKCPASLASATETAEKIKEPYIFLCDAGLMNIAFPLKTGDNSVTGCFFAGPVAMGTGKDSVVRKLIKKFYSRSDMMAKIVSFTYDMQVKTPEEVSYIYDVFCNCILPYIVMENNFGLISGNTGEQSPERKLPETSAYYPDTLPQDIINAVRSGDLEIAYCKFRLFYEKNYLLESGNLNLIKINFIDLFRSISKSVSYDTPDTLYSDEIENLHNTYSFSELYDTSNALIKKFTDFCSNATYQGDSEIIKRAIGHIKENYSSEITLASTAEKIHVSASYLSTLFRSETGKTFSQYLTQTRLAASIRMLKSTHLSITDIALACGFSNQSYYIKIFREAYGSTPKQYRDSV